MSVQKPLAHPGKILFEQVMQPLGVSRNKLARDIGVPVGRISDIVSGKRGITPDTALRLAKYLGTSGELWMRLQSDYDLFCARRDSWAEVEPQVQVFAEPDAGSRIETLDSGDAKAPDGPSEDSEMGQILPFSTPVKLGDDRVDAAPVPDTTHEEAIDCEADPAPISSGDPADDEFDLDIGPLGEDLEIPDPNEFRFREKPEESRTAD